MSDRRQVLRGLAGLFSAGAVAASAQDATPKREKNVVKGEREAKKMLLLMDKDNNGKVSKQEFMSFMEAEFDRLDVDKSGELDVKELTQARVRTTTGVSR